MGERSNSQLLDAIRNAGSGRKVSAIKLVRENPNAAATLSKLVRSDRVLQHNQLGEREFNQRDFSEFHKTSQRVQQSADDSKTTLEVLPDQELAAGILVSSVLSPKDMTTIELTYKLGHGLLPPDVSAAISECVKSYFETDYKIIKKLPDMVRKILIEKGSFPIAVIPENAVDEIINGDRSFTTESFSDVLLTKDNKIKPLGLLGPGLNSSRPDSRKKVDRTYSFESFPETGISENEQNLFISIENKNYDTGISVVDNYNVLKIPHIYRKAREQRIMSLTQNPFERRLQLARENFDRFDVTNQITSSIDIRSGTGDPSKMMTDNRLTDIAFRRQGFGFKPIASVKPSNQQSRKSVGNPLIMELPPEAIIPIYVPGSPDTHIGYFILLDQEGNPLSSIGKEEYYNQLGTRLRSGDNFAGAMLQRVNMQTKGFDYNDTTQIDQIASLYADLVEKDLLNRIRKGGLGENVEIGNNNEVYRIMLSRTLAKQQTHVLFIPAEMLTYFAYRYRDDGTGKTLLDDVRIVNSLRSMVMFAETMGMLKNSIGRTKVDVELDELDPDPAKTVQLVKSEMARARQMYFPIGTNNPVDLTEYLQVAGMEFSFSNHPKLPSMKVDISESNSNYGRIDSDLSENLRKMSIMGLGISPETVDNAFTPEFATSVLANNLLLSKRVILIQDVLCTHLSDHLKKIIFSSPNLVDEMVRILEENRDKIPKVEETDGRPIPEEYQFSRIVDEFVRTMEIELPKPDSATLETQMEAMDIYEKALDKGLEFWLSDKGLGEDVAGKLADKIEMIREVIKAHYMRVWMAKHGVLTELNELTISDENGGASLDVYRINNDHIGAVVKSIAGFLLEARDPVHTGDTTVDTLETSRGEEDGSGSDDSSSTDDTSSGGGAEDPMGGDFGFDDPSLSMGEDDATGGTEETPDEGGDTPPKEEETPAEETPEEKPE